MDAQTGTEKIYFIASRQRIYQFEQINQWSEPDYIVSYVQLNSMDDIILKPNPNKDVFTWQEAGKEFSVGQQQLDGLCDGCVYVFTFKHE